MLILTAVAAVVVDTAVLDGPLDAVDEAFVQLCLSFFVEITINY